MSIRDTIAVTPKNGHSGIEQARVLETFKPSPIVSTTATPAPKAQEEQKRGSAIVTPYNGINFRSRLEAKWAAMFDHLGVEWLYEMEGYELSRRYLPDFFIPRLQLWVEIKGVPPTTEERLACAELSIATKQQVLLSFGQVGWWLSDPCTGGSILYNEHEPLAFGYAPALCMQCRKGFSFTDRCYVHPCRHSGMVDPRHPDICRAVTYVNKIPFWIPPVDG